MSKCPECADRQATIDALRARCESLAAELANLGALHLADESDIFQLNKRLQETEVLRERHFRHWASLTVVIRQVLEIVDRFPNNHWNGRLDLKQFVLEVLAPLRNSLLTEQPHMTDAERLAEIRQTVQGDWAQGSVAVFLLAQLDAEVAERDALRVQLAAYQQPDALVPARMLANALAELADLRELRRVEEEERAAIAEMTP